MCVDLCLEGVEFLCELVVLLPEFWEWVLWVVVCWEFFCYGEFGWFVVLHDVEVSG